MTALRSLPKFGGWHQFVVFGVVAILAAVSRGDEQPASTVRITWQIRGLFCPEREREFRELCAEKLPAIRVVEVDMPNAEATLEFDPAAALGPPFKNAKPEALLHLLNGKLHQASHSTFFALPRRTTPLEKLVWIEIPFEGLDCQGCAYGVYGILVRLKGAEQATVDIRSGLATVLIDPEITNEQAIRLLLRQRAVGRTMFEEATGARREGRIDSAWRQWPASPPGRSGDAIPAPSAKADQQSVESRWGPPEFATIPGGSYQRGDVSGDAIDPTSRPVQSVTLGDYLLATTVTTKSQWDAVRTWAAARGYTDLAAGAGMAGDHPVHTVSWHDVVKWCNAASERDGLKPCYTVDKTVYRSGASDAVACDWQADGYRLPTEAEWEAAARGGLVGKRFPWGDAISHKQANYIAGPDLKYDESGTTAGHHPQFALVGAAGTSPVKTFPPNGFGLFDMAGNVSQWCWDWFGVYPEKPFPDPKGPAQGSLRILRGGHWNNSAVRAACGFRVTGFPSLANTNVGFRLARSRSAGKSAGGQGEIP